MVKFEKNHKILQNFEKNEKVVKKGEIGPRIGEI